MKSKSITLLRIQLYELFGFNKLRHSKDKEEKRKGILFGMLAILVVIVVCGYSFGMAYGYAYLGLKDMLPMIMMTTTSLLVLATTFFKSNGVLFGIKDYDLIMSLPVKKSTLIISRFLTMYILDLLFTIGVMIPTMVVCIMFGSGDILFYFLYVVSLFFIPLFPMVIASALGAIITLIASRTKYRSLAMILLSLAAILAVMFLSFQSGSISEEKLTQITALISEQMTKLYPLAGWYHEALSHNNMVAFMGFLLVSICTFLVFVKGVSIIYSSIQTSLTTQKSTSNYIIDTLKKNSPLTALYKKELKRYFSCPVYVINTMIGIIFLPALAITLLFLSPQQLEVMMQMPGLAVWVKKVMPLVESMMIVLSCTTSASISLEGKNRWILQSLPVRKQVIFNSKIAVNLTLTLPVVLASSVIVSIGQGMSLMETVNVLVTPIVYAVFIAELGIVMNLKFPNYEWTNEVTVVKQGASTMLTMLIGFLSVLCPVSIVFLFQNVSPLLLISMFTALLILICIVLYRYMGKQKI